MAILAPIFTALFDYTQSVPTLTLTDPGTEYSSGLAVTGWFSITQPDGLTRAGNATAPDITLSAPTAGVFSIPLRLACDGTVQQGTYTIVYTVAATGYTNGVKSYTFVFNLTIPTGAITTIFDVFTPLLTATDATVYTVAGYNAVITRVFTGLIQAINELVTTTGTLLTLSYGGQFYDSEYTLNLASTIVYTNATLTWLSAKVSLTAQNPSSTGLLQANTPLSCVALLNQLTTYQNTVNNQDCNCSNSTLNASLTTAQALLNQINALMAAATYTGLYALIVAFENIVLNNQFAYTNTGAVIQPFVYTCGQSGGGGGSTVVPVSVAFTVGSAGYLFNGLNTATFASLATGSGNPKSVVVFAKGGTSLTPGIDYTFTPSTGNVLLLNGAVFTNGENVNIFAIYNT